MNKYVKHQNNVPYGPNRKGWQEQIPAIAKKGGKCFVSAPRADPNDIYMGLKVELLDSTDLQLPPRALTEAERKRALLRVETHEEFYAKTYLGQQNQSVFLDVDFQTHLSRYMNTLLNNIGDPFISGSLGKNTKFAECAVLDYYASLWNAKWPSDPEDPDSHWGYVLSMGSTEGNLYSLLQGRDYLKGRPLHEGRQKVPDPDLGGETAGADQTVDNPNAFRPVAFFSEDRHYSILKALRAMEIPAYGDVGAAEYPGECPITEDGRWPLNVPSLEPDAAHPVGSGIIDIDKLETLVEFFAARGHPILLVLTVGTTFKGAHDPVDEIGERLMPVFRRHGLAQRRVWTDPAHPDHCDWRTGFWIHVDGALGAAYLPFLEMAHHAGQTAQRGPIFDFRLPYVHSLVMSGHKWPGTPWPTGIYMTKRKYLIKPPEDPDYIGAPDTTFAGSRNGLSPLLLWWYAAVMSYDAQVERILHCQRIADYAEQRLRELSDVLQIDLWVQRSPLSLSILFRKPNDVITSRYSLSTQYVPSPDRRDEWRNYAHIYCMGSVDEQLIDRFVKELSEPGAFPDMAADEIEVKHTPASERSRHGSDRCGRTENSVWARQRVVNKAVNNVF